jgi:hypothetical protein
VPWSMQLLSGILKNIEKFDSTMARGGRAKLDQARRLTDLSPSARARPGGGWLLKESVCQSALLPTFRQCLEIRPSHEALLLASCPWRDDLFSA